MRPDVVEALSRWKALGVTPTEPADYVFAENGVPVNVAHMAEQVRNDLSRVGVTRPQLFQSAKTRQRFRAHDLRATFVTISLATGRTEAWVSDRTGHDGHTMIRPPPAQGEDLEPRWAGPDARAHSGAAPR